MGCLSTLHEPHLHTPPESNAYKVAESCHERCLAAHSHISFQQEMRLVSIKFKLVIIEEISIVENSLKLNIVKALSLLHFVVE